MGTVSAANLIRLRTTNHATRVYLAVHQPTVLVSGQINGGLAAGATSIPLKTITAIGTPFRHCTVRFGTSAGDDSYGTTRALAWSSPTLTIPPNNFDWAGDEWVTIVAEIQPQSIKPAIGATSITEDGIAYSDQNTKFHPLARMGSPACAFIDATTGLATVNFYSRSIAVANGATLSAHAWAFPSGTPATSATAGTSGAPVVVTWDTAGQYLVTLTVTDSNGKTHTRYTPVFIFNRYGTSNVPYSQVEIGSIESNLDGGGWTATLSVKGISTDAVFPDRARVVLFAEDYYGTEQISIGGDYTYRENIIMSGFIKGASVKIDSRKGTADFQIAGIGAFMDSLPAYASNYKYVAAPAGWHDFANLTSNAMAFHILTEHSTVDHVDDLDLAGIEYSDYTFDVTDGTLREQVCSQVYGAFRSVCGSSRLGCIYARQNPQLVALASRTEAKILDQTNVDVRAQIDVSQELLAPAASQVDFVGYNFVGGARKQVFSLAPGVPNEFGRIERVDGIRVTDQTESNTISGYYAGWKNNKYPDVQIQWRGNYRVFDCFPPEHFTVTLTAAQNNRGLVFTAAKFRPKRVSFQIKSGVLTVDTNAEMDSYGAAGIPGNYPSDPPFDDPVYPYPIYPPIDPYDPPVPDYPPGPYEPGEIRSRVYAATDAGLFYTSNFTDVGGAMPTWARVETGLGAINVRVLTADPVSPSTTQYALIDEAYAADRENRVYKRTGGAWSVILDNEDLITLFGLTTVGTVSRIDLITTNVSLAGYLAVVWMYSAVPGGQTFYYAYSTDYGATWQKHNTTPIGMNMNGVCNGFTHGLFRGASSVAAGNMVYMSNAGAANKLWVSSDSGATWAARSNFATENTGSFFIQIDYWQDTIYCYSSAGIKRSTDRGVTWSQINTAITDLTNQGQQPNGYCLTMSHYDPALNVKSNILMAVGYQQVVYRSLNAGVAWTSYTNTDNAWGIGFNRAEMGMFAMPDADGKFYGVGIYGGANTVAKVKVTNDYGVTWEDKAGADITNGTVNGIPGSVNIVGLLPIYA